MSPSSAAERKAAERARKRKAGFKPREVWVHDDDWEKVQRLIERLAKRRQDNQKEDQA